MGAGASSADNEGGLFEASPVAHMLGKMFQMMDGTNWLRGDGWGEEKDETAGFAEPDFSAWFGLGVNKYKDVIRISLPRNRLAGHLPFTEKFVRTMVELRAIDLESNRIGGPFPPTWCLLKNLTDLNLNKNGIRGTFPDAIGNLITLKKLKLGQNQMYGKLPLTFSKLTELTRLELHRNRLEGSAEMLGNLAKLHTLKINENLFTGELPKAWLMLENIREVYLFSNHFSVFKVAKHVNPWSQEGGDDRELTDQNLQVLDVMRKRCYILVMLEEQVGDGGFIAERLPPRAVWPNQPHLYGNGFTSVSLQSHPADTLKALAKIRNEDRDLPTT
mmetsp:Transcript_30658/g.62332  ORF Transcript_30658/g.62332 Transcript_30658/m.62332 type:complete len:331 (+) Transcript_30658:110-1102(+)